ncbi:hypothetical protein ACFQV2_38885 [Actinokineospora soli]|uniref:TadE-like protein n=1 Tax=Actinokineospora soli TaxID=1048753 RepID=A0ABW2TYJ7_9PSEU
MGEVLITLGLIILLFVAYEVYVTDLFSAAKQRDATAALDQRWTEDEAPSQGDPERVERFEGLAEGAGFAKMFIPPSAPTTRSPSSRAPPSGPWRSAPGTTPTPPTPASPATSPSRATGSARAPRSTTSTC